MLTELGQKKKKKKISLGYFTLTVMCMRTQVLADKKGNGEEGESAARRQSAAALETIARFVTAPIVGRA